MAFPTLFGHDPKKDVDWWQIPILVGFGGAMLGPIIHHFRLRTGPKVLEPLQPWEIVLLTAMPYLWIVLYFRRKGAKREWARQSFNTFMAEATGGHDGHNYSFRQTYPNTPGGTPTETTLDNLQNMSGLQFEQHMANLFRSRGYMVHLTKASGDQGVDLLLSINARKIAIQLKRYTLPVGNSAVQEVFAGQHFYQADEAWVITTSSFTSSAGELAKRLKVRLVGGAELTQWIGNP